MALTLGSNHRPLTAVSLYDGCGSSTKSTTKNGTGTPVGSSVAKSGAAAAKAAASSSKSNTSSKNNTAAKNTTAKSNNTKSSQNTSKSKSAVNSAKTASNSKTNNKTASNTTVSSNVAAKTTTASNSSNVGKTAATAAQKAAQKVAWEEAARKATEEAAKRVAEAMQRAAAEVQKRAQEEAERKAAQEAAQRATEEQRARQAATQNVADDIEVKIADVFNIKTGKNKANVTESSTQMANVSVTYSNPGILLASNDPGASIPKQGENYTYFEYMDDRKENIKEEFKELLESRREDGSNTIDNLKKIGYNFLEDTEECVDELLDSGLKYGIGMACSGAEYAENSWKNSVNLLNDTLDTTDAIGKSTAKYGTDLLTNGMIYYEELNENQREYWEENGEIWKKAEADTKDFVKDTEEDWKTFKEEVRENIEEYQTGDTDSFWVTAGKTAIDVYQLKERVKANGRNLICDYGSGILNFSWNSTKTGFRNIGSAWNFGVSNVRSTMTYGTDIMETGKKQMINMQNADKNMHWEFDIFRWEMEKRRSALELEINESIDKYIRETNSNIKLAKIQGYNFERHTEQEIKQFCENREADVKDIEKEVKEDVEEATTYVEETIEEMPLEEKAHFALDALGLLYDGADGANALLYAAEGRHEEAVISAAALIPIGGIFATGSKWTDNITDWGKGLSDIFKITKKGVSDVTSFTDEVVEGMAKQGDELTEEVAEKVGKEVIEGGTDVLNNLKPQNLMDELASSGVKYNPDDVIAVTKTADGKLVWLENGTDTAGLNHIITEHADDFLNKGITQEQIPDYVMNALENGKIVGYQGRGTGRPIYEFTYNGEIHKVAITVGDNGFVVGANPK